jgi:hypothetical protein
MALKEIEARTSEDTAQETDVGEFQHIRTEPEWKNYFEHLKKEKKVSLVPFWADESKYFGSCFTLL